MPSITSVCVNKEQILTLPFLNNPFVFNGRKLEHKAIQTANCFSIRDIYNKSGKIDASILCSKLKIKGVTFRAKNIVSLCQKVKNCLKPAWLNLLEGEAPTLEKTPVSFSLCCGGKDRNISEVKTNVKLFGLIP